MAGQGTSRRTEWLLRLLRSGARWPSHRGPGGPARAAPPIAPPPVTSGAHRSAGCGPAKPSAAWIPLPRRLTCGPAGRARGAPGGCPSAASASARGSPPPAAAGGQAPGGGEAVPPVNEKVRLAVSAAAAAAGLSNVPQPTTHPGGCQHHGPAPGVHGCRREASAQWSQAILRGRGPRSGCACRWHRTEAGLPEVGVLRE